MKGLVIKDFYNVVNNGWGLFIMMLILAVAIVPTQGFLGYLVAGTVVCSMMSTTSFAIDNNSKWEQFAITFPIDRKDIVKGKFITLFLFTMIGILLSIILGSLAAVIFQSDILQTIDVKEIGQMIIVGISVALIFGTNSIALLLKFGAEKARMFLILGYVIPGAILIYVVDKLQELGVIFTGEKLNQFIYLLPILVIIWLSISYTLAVAIMKKKQY
ncbi:membrane protein [Virgibacillus pantothenticus]|uniref:ABC-2 transporter permease n=1 Tax=Virgibacillus pantothenticus TaxID=1473 RepID=UPI001B16AAA4|nr:ABC-2 transporter permease [Virgibacillus pantothenticus]GIP65348.1 membrane protein [Virgibacillus pantothenticus]